MGVSIVMLAILVALAAGLVIGVVVSAPPPPTELQAGSPVTSMTVSERDFDDETEVAVIALKQEEQSLTTDAAGKITSFVCSPGQPLTSGTTVFAVDGQPVVNLFTKVPMWRDLAIGDRGTDATAINDELSRLGYSSGGGNTVTRATVAGFRQLLLDLGGSKGVGVGIATGSVLWLPAESVYVDSCSKRTGESVEPGDAVVILPANLTSVTLTSRAQQHIPGDRVLLLGTEEIPVPGSRTITDEEALAKIAQSSQFVDAATDGDAMSVQFSAKWKLAKPVTVSVVPPSALVGLTGGTGCVVVDGQVQKVNVVGSELGQSFVVFDSDDMSGRRVEIKPDPKTKCE